MHEVTVFQYEQLDATTADFLRKKESNMRDIVGQAYTNLGRELKEAQDALAKNGYGCFQSWAESVGIKRNKVYDLIRRYETIVRISDEQTRELIEDLPVSLTYEIAKPSAESTPARAQAKSEVLEGKIDTLKAYRERIAKLESQAKQAAEKAEQAESARQIAEEINFCEKLYLNGKFKCACIVGRKLSETCPELRFCSGICNRRKKFKKMQKSTLHSSSADDIIKVGMSIFCRINLYYQISIYNVIIQEDEQQCKRKSKNLS